MKLSNGPIILVDDDEDEFEYVNTALQEIGITNELIYFSSAKEFLLFLKRTNARPLIILCDINMPYINGFELKEIINSDAYLHSKSIPFVYVTNGINKTSINVAYNHDVQGFFKKQDTMVDTKNLLKKIIDYWKDSYHPYNTSN